MASHEYYGDDAMFGSTGAFQTSASSKDFNQGFNQPNYNQQEFYWNLPSKAQPPLRSNVVKTPGSKRRNFEGKTPAQALNELFKGTTDAYDKDGMMFKCSLTVDGQVFHAISSSKKNAKHEACLLALKSLRPDVAAEMAASDTPTNSFSIHSNNFGAPQIVGTTATKKRKVDSIDSSSSLKELLSKLCLEGNKKYKIDSTDVTEAGGDLKLRKLSAVLTFEDEGKMYTHTAEGANVANTMVMRQALKDLFNVSEESLLKVIKRGQLKKLHNMQSFSIHPASLDAAAVEHDSSINAVSQLFQIGSRQKPSLRPEFMDMGEEMNGTDKYFKFKCVVGGREFLGSGKSKKDAKNESANLALNNIFHMNIPVKRDDEGHESTNDTICNYVRTQYQQMCNFYGMNPSSDFTCFVLLNENNEKKLISIGSSPQSVTPLGVVAESGGKAILHHDSVIYARRAALRFLITQLAKAEKREESCLEESGGGMFRLKQSLRMAIVTSQPIDIRFSAPESTIKRLGVYGQCNLLEAVNEKEEPRVHCVADKIFKWCHLGIQGSLLTNRINPIIPCSILTMTRCPLSDVSYMHSFTSRICAPPFPIGVHSSRISIDTAPSPAHMWSRAESKLEKVSHYTGLTSEGIESCCCKYQLYKAFLDATPRFPKGIPYTEAKKMAGGYISSRDLFYHEMVKAGLGKWNGVRGLGDRFVIG